jgi:iron complex transport system permease protein
VLVGCTLVLAAVMVLGVAIGSVGLSPAQVWRVIEDHVAGRPRTSVADEIVWQIRMPRVLLAALVGAALTTAGTVVQALVRNALADPFLLGVSSGASVGATAVLLFGVFASLGVWALSLGSVLGAMGAMATVFVVSRSGRQLAPTQLILCGVVLSAMFEAVASFLLFKGNPQATQAVLFWLLGSFGNATWAQLPIPAAALVVGMGYLLAQARNLNALAMGSEPAAALGVEVAGLRRNLFVVTSLMVGVAVAVSGVIGFVGLVIPHIVRLVVGSDHRRVLAVGVPVGAAFMAAADLMARTIVSPQEMPIGVITAFIGAPTLLVLIRRRPYLYGATQ